MPYLVLVATIVVWSFSFLAAARLRQDLGLGEALAARFVPVLVGALGLLAVRRPLRIPRGAWPAIVAMGVMSVPAYNAAFFHGLKTVPTGTAALVIALSPVFTAILARVFLGEPFGPKKVLGAVLALVGLFVVIRFGTNKEVTWPYLSSALVLALAPLSWAVYIVVGRSLPRGTDALDGTYASLVVGSLPLVFLVRPSTPETLVRHPGAFAAAAYLAVPCTLLGFAAFIWALQRVPANETAAFIFLNPPLANVWAWLFEGAPLRLPFVAGAAVLMAGVAAIVLPGPSRAAVSPTPTSGRTSA